MIYGQLKRYQLVDGVSEWLVVCPANAEITATDGRDSFSLNEEAAHSIIKVFDTNGLDLPVDFEHSTIHRGDAGLRADAIGWVKSLRWSAEKGLEAKIDWLAEGVEVVGGRKYRYLSPTLHFREGAPWALHSIALTNKPAIVNQEALLAASSGFGRKGTMGKATSRIEKYALSDELMASVSAVLSDWGVETEGKDESALIAALVETLRGAMEEDSEMFGEMRAALGLKEGGKEAVISKCHELTGHIGYVPADRAKSMENELEALRGKIGDMERVQLDREAESAVSGYVDSGQLDPADEEQMNWARRVARESLANFNALMSHAPTIRFRGDPLRHANGSGSTKRDKLIADSFAEFKGSGFSRGMKPKSYIDRALAEAGVPAMTKGEVEALGSDA